MKKLLSKYKYHLFCFVAGFVVAILLCSLGSETKTVNTSQSYVEKTSSEYVKGKEDTTRMSVTVAFKKKGTVVTKNVGRGVKNENDSTLCTHSSTLASFDTIDAETGFAANIKYDIDENEFDNTFIIPQLEISRTDTLKKNSSLVSARDAEVGNATSLRAESRIWSLNLGIQHNFETGFYPHKYITLRYKQQVLFINLICEAGFYNKINESLNNIKPLLKAELSLGL